MNFAKVKTDFTNFGKVVRCDMRTLPKLKPMLQRLVKMILQYYSLSLNYSII